MFGFELGPPQYVCDTDNAKESFENFNKQTSDYFNNIGMIISLIWACWLVVSAFREGKSFNRNFTRGHLLFCTIWLSATLQGWLFACAFPRHDNNENKFSGLNYTCASKTITDKYRWTTFYVYMCTLAYSTFFELVLMLMHFEPKIVPSKTM